MNLEQIVPSLSSHVPILGIRIVSNAIEHIVAEVISPHISVVLSPRVVHLGIIECFAVNCFFNIASFGINLDHIVSLKDIGPDFSIDKFKFVDASNWLATTILNCNLPCLPQCSGINMCELIGAVSDIERVVIYVNCDSPACGDAGPVLSHADLSIWD